MVVLVVVVVVIVVVILVVVVVSINLHRTLWVQVMVPTHTACQGYGPTGHGDHLGQSGHGLVGPVRGHV